MSYTRELKRYMRGDDVKQVKDKLVELGYLHASTHDMYGNDTYKSVKNFQADNRLEVNGIVGYDTWGKLIGHDPVPEIPIPRHVSAEVATALKSALATVDNERREVCLLALEYATDVKNPDYPRGFYIRGANLYDRDLSLHLMTPERLKKYFSNERYKQYYDGGRQEMMEKYAYESQYSIPGADCSGFIVGLWRARKIASPNFDATANSLFKSYCVETSSPKPGDLCWKEGHIGLYVGAGYAIESAGGAYGVQLTTAPKRKLYNFVTNKIQSVSSWSKYGDPKWY